MKFKFKQANDEPRELDIPNTITSEQLKTILMSKLNFPVGQYLFCYGGKILTQHHPLEHINEGSTIICVIKQHQNMEIPKPLKLYKIETKEIVNIQSNPTETLKLASTIKSTSNSSKIEAPEPTVSFTQKQFRDITNEEKRTIKNVSDLLCLDKVYNTSFWDYPETAAQFINVANDDPNVLMIVETYLRDHFSSSIKNATKMPDNGPLLLLGIKFPQRVNVIDDFEVAMLSLSNQQREGFEVIMRQGFDKDKAMEAYLKNECDVEKTLQMLRK